MRLFRSPGDFGFVRRENSDGENQVEINRPILYQSAAGGGFLHIRSQIMLIKFAISSAIVLLFAGCAFAQKQVQDAAGGSIRSTPAYAELLLHKTDLQAELDSLLVDYTDDYPKAKEIRLELGFLKVEMDRVLSVKPADISRLSQALGKLMLKKVELETELDSLRARLKDEHPEVKKARKKVESFEAAIKEILGQ